MYSKVLFLHLTVFILEIVGEEVPSVSKSTLDCHLAEKYTGTVSWTVNGRTCQSWAHQWPHEHNFTTNLDFPDCSISDGTNYCRDPIGWGLPWCFTINREAGGEVCDVGVPICNVDCYDKNQPNQFIGEVSTFEDGTVCQAWSEQTPHEHSFNQPGMFPRDDSVLAANNYCRDPEGAGRLWCYTMNPEERWRWCPVPMCNPILS